MVNRIKSVLKNMKNTTIRPIGEKPPYPVSVQTKVVEHNTPPSPNDVGLFDEIEANKINQARLAHLSSLQLSFADKTVLDVGCGVGHLAQFFVRAGSKVVCVDGREENIVALQSQYPNLTAHVVNVDTDSLVKFGKFDIVFCYGLLYHLENPLRALRNMKAVCGELLLLETLICDHSLPLLQLVDEPLIENQALGGLGCRPSPSYVVQALSRVGYLHVYAPKEPPLYRDFQIKWKNNLEWWRDDHPLRCVFIASTTKLQNPQLISLLED